MEAKRIADLEQERDELKQMLDMLVPKGEAALFPAPAPLRLQRVPTQHGDEVAIAPNDLKVGCCGNYRCGNSSPVPSVATC